MKKKQGFTLIELLAVIVILAIIALIATPLILNVIETAKIGAVKSSALGYMDAVEKQVAINQLDSSKANINDGVYTVSALTNDYKVTVKGQVPSEGWVSISKGIVTGYSLKIGDYAVSYNVSESTDQNVEKGGSLTTPPSEPIEGTNPSEEEIVYTPEECFQISNNGNVTATIIDYLCVGGSENEILDVVIPKKIESLTVTSIGSSAFLDNQLTSITIPNSVTRIDSAAFLNNQLTSIIIPNGVTSIGDSAFYGNQLTSIEISNSVTSIDRSAFMYNRLTKVEIPSSVTSIGPSAFGNNQLTSVKIHNIQSNVTLGSNAFGWPEGYSDENIEWLG